MPDVGVDVTSGNGRVVNETVGTGGRCPGAAELPRWTGLARPGSQGDGAVCEP
jgi:hypothetical protein